MEVYIRPFDAGKPEAPPAASTLQVSKDGAIGMVSWRQDAKEMYFMTRDWEVMAVDITTGADVASRNTQAAVQVTRSAARATRRNGKT